MKKKLKKRSIKIGMQKSFFLSLIAFMCLFIVHLSSALILSDPLPSSTEPLRLYSNTNGEDLSQVYLDAIQKAKKSITLTIYSLLDASITQALNSKAQAGIPVHIICDAKASPAVTTKVPYATIVRRAGKGLTHQKILVVDNNQILIGSANMTTDSLNRHGNLVIGLDHPHLAELLTAKAQSMNEDGKSIPLLHQETEVGSQRVELWMLPDESKASERIISLLQSAKKTIKVAMFTWTRKDFAQQLIQASIRGVQVEAVIDHNSGKGVSAKVVDLLAKAKLPVRLSNGKALFHYKFAWIDDKILVNGSANWTLAAFNTNDDCFLIVHDLTKEQKAQLRGIWKTILRESDPVL